MTKQEIEKGFQEIWKLFAETDKKIDKAIGGLTGKWSSFVEGLIAPAVEKLFKQRGIEVDKIYQRVKAHRNGDEMEVDILAINGEYAVLIEAKSTLKIEDVNDHIQRLETFKDFFPEYQDKKVIGAVAGIVIEEGADKYAYRNGMYVIGQSGEAVRILNDKRFKPGVW